MGTYLFFGDLPAELRNRAAGVENNAPMTADELEAYLSRLSLPQLVLLGQKVTPPLRARANMLTMTRALVRAYRSPAGLDPEAFYFTRCWTHSGTDTFIPAW